MIRIAKQTDPRKLAELKIKIHDDDYLTIAIQRLAQSLTKELVDKKESHGTT